MTKVLTKVLYVFLHIFIKLNSSSIFLKNKKTATLSRCLVPKTGVEPVRCCHRRILSPVRLPIPPLRQIWRHHPESNWGMKVLQTLALPLGYGAIPLLFPLTLGELKMKS